MKPTPLQARLQAARGMATLTVVMILFFVMALVAAYTNRNLIFEQRISANSYRSSMALEAADAGTDWAVAMLNSGRVDDNCNPSNNVADLDFRRRYLLDDTTAPNGEGGYVANPGQGLPACISRNGVLNCSCPSAAVPNPALVVPADGLGQTFRIRFIRPGGQIWPGAMEIVARGCFRPGAGVTACYSQTNDTPDVDSATGALVTVGLVRALPVPPIATLTAGTTITAAPGVVLRVGNTDASTGLTAHAGGAITAPDGVFTGPGGAANEGKLPVDGVLDGLRLQANEGWFRALFGMDATTYQYQPAVVRVVCAAACTRADIAARLASHPRNVLWIQGDLNLDSAGVMGDTVDPMLLVVSGRLTVSANVRMVGFVHADNVQWTAGADLASVQGAMVALNDFTAAANGTLAYDKAVLDLIRLRYGSFVRAPAGWSTTGPNS